MNNLDWWQREALYRHISSVVHGPIIRLPQYRVKANKVSWKAKVRYSDQYEDTSGSVLLKDLHKHNPY
jgi:hypothetical protein